MTKPKPKPPAGLSHAAIVAAALRLIDREGLEGFSTRKLGHALGCEAMAIYWYYPSKDALLEAVVDELTAPLTAALARETDWIELLRGVAHAYRAIARAHPNAFPLLATRRFTSERTHAFMEQLFALARTHGIDDRVAARFYRIVSSYCSGFALNEIAPPPDTVALRKRFTRVAAIGKWLEPRYLDEIFELGLELQLEALATSSRRARARSR